MNTPPRVFILVLNYNGKATLPACLRSLLRLDFPRAELVVIDNASSDGSFEKAKTVAPRAIFIQNSHNVGFARGINVGIRFALEQGADFVWIVNPDAIASKESLSRLVTLMERHPKVGLASPLVLSPTGRHIWFGGGRINWLRFRAVHTKPRSRTTPYETGFLSGCALLVRRDVFESIGLFDERFFLYYEDADFSLRAKRAGFQTVVHPLATVSHSEESRHNPKKIYWLVRSGLLFFSLHFPGILRPYFRLAFWARRLRNLLRLRKSKRREWILQEEAFRDFLTYDTKSN